MSKSWTTPGINVTLLSPSLRYLCAPISAVTAPIFQTPPLHHIPMPQRSTINLPAHVEKLRHRETNSLSPCLCWEILTGKDIKKYVFCGTYTAHFAHFCSQMNYQMLYKSLVQCSYRTHRSEVLHRFCKEQPAPLMLFTCQP